MRWLLPLTFLTALLPGLAGAQTVSTTIQSGEGNESLTVQSGQTYAATIQVGSGNFATTTLSGTRTLSVVNQWGSSNSLEQTLSGSNQGLFTQQIETQQATGHGGFSLTGGSVVIGVTIQSEMK